MKKKTNVGKPSGKVIKAHKVSTGSKTKADTNKTTKRSNIRIASDKQTYGAKPKGKSGQTMTKKRK